MELDPSEQDPSATYRIVSSTVTPRPIGWISTRSADGVDNLAPYSYFNAISSSPPVVMFSAGRTDGELKDTPRNALDSEVFVYNLVTESVAAKMDKTSASIDPGESEFEMAGIDRKEAATIDAPRVANALVSFECTLYDSMEIYGNTVVFGEVVYIHIDDEVLTDGAIDTRKIDAVGRLGGRLYTATDIMDLQRGN